MAKERILGLDIGTTSIGFALIDYDREAHSGEIIHLGVRIFPETLDAKTKVPLNQQRRAKRLVRRQVRRRKQRRKALNELLAAEGFLPEFGSAEWDTLMREDPYVLRRRGLSSRLEPHELGRAIYHLAQRRHFRGRDIALEEQSDSSEEDSTQKADREELLKRLKSSGKTLGEYLEGIEPGERKRKHLASREVVLNEFNRLLDHQADFYEIAALRSQLHDVIFSQKPVFWRKNTLGSCKFNPDSELCPSGSWIAQQRKMLEKINNIAIDGNNEPLNDKERECLIKAASQKGELTWDAVRKELEPVLSNHADLDLRRLKFNLETGGERKLQGNKLEQDLIKIFGSDWQEHASRDSIRKNIFKDLFECDYREVGSQRIEILRENERTRNREELVNKLKRKYNVTEEEARKLAEINVKTGWEPYATKTIEIFVKELEAGHRMGDLLNSEQFENWRLQTFPNQEIAASVSGTELPTPKSREERKRLDQIKNPTVVRTQNELRKVVNNLIRTYGRPDLIRVELARDLKNSKKRRIEMQANMKSNERQRNDARKDLEEKHINNPTGRDIEKWILWKECHQKCPFTGKCISFNALFGPSPSVEIEHIWPGSISGDDSLANKTLCFSTENQKKNNRTPYEYLHRDKDRWVQLQNRLESMRKTKGFDYGMSIAKIRRFQQKEIPDDFVERQLVDTSYASRETVASLKRLWTSSENDATVKVQAVSGRATSKMRYLWGLNDILSNDGSKTRNDHRHHAVDAFTVACIYPGAVSALLKKYYENIEGGLKAQLQLPWSNVRNDLASKLEQVTVSHKVVRKVSGALHEETIFGVAKELTGDSQESKMYVTRKPIEIMTKKEKINIRDEHIRKLATDFSAGSDSPVTIGNKGRVVQKSRYTVKQQPEFMRPVTTGFAKVGNNHHMAIYKNKHGEIQYSVVSMFDAADRVRKRKTAVDRNITGLNFVNSLCQSDAIAIDSTEKKGIWIVNSIWSSGVLVLSKHNDASKDKKETIWRPKANTLCKLGFKKLSIDPIGNYHLAND